MKDKIKLYLKTIMEYTETKNPEIYFKNYETNYGNETIFIDISGKKPKYYGNKFDNLGNKEVFTHNAIAQHSDIIEIKALFQFMRFYSFISNTQIKNNAENNAVPTEKIG